MTVLLDRLKERARPFYRPTQKCDSLVRILNYKIMILIDRRFPSPQMFRKVKPNRQFL